MNRTGRAKAKTWLLLATLSASALARSPSGAGATPGTPTPSAANGGVSPPSIDWQSPSDCPPPRARLDELLAIPSKHPLWGEVRIVRSSASWTARLHLTDGPSGAPNVSVSDRTLEGNTCAEVTEAALLVVSIMQREQAELDRTPVTEPPLPPPTDEPTPAATPPVPAPMAPTSATKPVATRSPQKLTESTPAPSPSPPKTTSIALGATWSLWNGKSPALGVSAEFEHSWGRFAIRPQLGWSASVNPIPTTESVKVSFTSYDAGLRLCFNMVAGVNVCGGPTLQRITVAGAEVGEPVESSAWFPGASAALLGSQEHSGFGVWGAIGTNFRFKEIALEVTPLGEVASIKRLTVYAWVGPQWRWR